MKKKKIFLFLIVVGYISILINSLEYLIINNPYLLILSFLFFIYLTYKEKYSNKEYFVNLIPFSSGLLTFIMRGFYIDRFDYAVRLNNLILLSLVFSLISLIIKHKLYEKLLNRFNLYSVKKRVFLIFIITEIIFILSSFILVKKGVILVGDEPHYLAISHSIAKDFDINVFNQYARDEYKEFINYKIRSHAMEGKGFKKWYSIHLPGVSLTLAPFLLFKIPFSLLYFLLRSFMGLFGAGIAVLVYLFSTKLLKKDNISLFNTVVFTLTAPVFFMSIHIFAEIQATFFILLSLYLLIFAEFKNKQRFKYILSGFFISLTIFWGVKYLLFIAFYMAGTFFLFVKNKKIKNIIYVSFFPVLFIIIFMIFLNYAYGTISPDAVYRGVLNEDKKAEFEKNTSMIPLSLKVETLFDYFFDQRDGLLLYNPFYFFFFPGLFLAIKKFRKYYLFILISIPGFIYYLYHGYSTIRAGYCPQARYLTPIAWLLFLFAVIYYIESENQFFKRLFFLIPLYSFFIVLYQLFNPFTLYQQTTHDTYTRSGLLFQKFSNLYFNISEFLPSFAKIDGNFKYIPNIIIIIFIIFLIFLSLRKIDYDNFKFINILVFILIFIIVSLFPKIPLYNPIKVIDNINKTNIPFFFYSNKNPSGRVFSDGFGTIKGNGEFKFYLSIPKAYYIKNRKLFNKGFSAKLSFINVGKPFVIDIYNYNVEKLHNKVCTIDENSFQINKIDMDNLNSKYIIVITIKVKKNLNKKPVDFRLNLFFLNVKLN